MPHALFLQGHRRDQWSLKKVSFWSDHETKIHFTLKYRTCKHSMPLNPCVRTYDERNNIIYFCNMLVKGETIGRTKIG